MEKKQITGAISVNNQDIECFEKLYEKGIELEIRQVAKDNKINLIDRLKELKFL